MIFWIDNTSIYDCRTYSLIKPQQYDVAIILDYIKQDQQQNRIDLKEKLPKLLRTLALLLLIHNKKDIFRLLQILASKDFKYTKLHNDFMNSPSAQWYIEQMKLESVQMIMNQYIQGEYKFLEGFFQKITNSYEQYIQKQQNEQGTPEFNQQVEVFQNQDLTSSNKTIDKSQQNQQYENQINKNQSSKCQIEESNIKRKKSTEEKNPEKDSISTILKGKNDIKKIQDTKNLNQMTSKEPIQKQTLDSVQQQQLNKEKVSKSTIEIEDKLQYQQQQQQQQNEQNNNKQKIVQQQQLDIKNQKEQNNLENQKGTNFSEQQKVSLESVSKDDKPDQKMLEMAKILSEKAQKKSSYSPLQSPSKFKLNPKPLEKITEKVEKRVNIEQKIAKKFNQEPEKISSYIDTLTEKEQQEFEFSEDTELIKLFDLLKEKCEQTYWWTKFQDKCHKAMMDKELEMIMFEKLPILMKRWAIKTGKNVTEMERNPNRRHRTPIQETKNTLLDYSDPEEMTKQIIHVAQSSENLEKKKQIVENQKIDDKVNLELNELNNNGINKLYQQNEQNIKYQNNHEYEQTIKYNQKNEFKNSSEFQQHQIQNSKIAQDNLNKENNNFTSRLDDDSFNNQNQSILVEQELLLQNEIQEVTPYQIIDIDDEIFYKNFPVDNQKSQQSKVIKTVANRFNSEINNSRQQQMENPNKLYQQQDTSIQNNIEKQKNVIFIDSASDEIIQSKKTQQSVPQQQIIQITEDYIEIQNQPIVKSNIVYPNSNVQSEFNQNDDDIDKLFQNENDISSPDSMVSSSSILISEQSSIQFEEVQTNKNQFESKEQLNQQKNKDIVKVPEKNLEKYDVKDHREEEQKSREKKPQESDIEIKDKQKTKSNKRYNSKDNSENQKTKSKRKDSKNDDKEKSRAKSSSQNKEKNREKEKNKETHKRKSSEKKNTQDILKNMQAEKEAKERQKDEWKKKEKEKIHQENIKKAEQKLDKLRFDEIEYQKEYNYLQQQSKQNEIEPGEIKQQQYQNQHKYNQQPPSQSQQNNKNVNQQEQNQRLKPQEVQILDSQNVNSSSKFQQQNQQMVQKTYESQSNVNRPQQQNQSQEKSVTYTSDQKNQNNNWEYQKNQQAKQQNYNQFDRQQKNYINQNPTEQVSGQENQQQRPNSYAFPLEQYGIQEFLTKKDQAIQKSMQKSIVNPVQYDLAQGQPPVINQGNYQKQQQQYPQNYQQAQFQPQQQQQSFQQQQYYNSQKPKDKKFRNNQPHQQDFYRQKQQYQNQSEPHLQKQRKYNPNNEQQAPHENFNYIPEPQHNMNVQPYPYNNQMNDHQFANQNPFPFPNGQNYQSNQPSKQQMFEFFCQMFYDKFQQPE